MIFEIKLDKKKYYNHKLTRNTSIDANTIVI